MKWLALILIILAAPAIAAWLRSNPRQAPYVYGLLSFLPFVQGPWHLDIAPFATPLWSGYVKGWEVGLIDAVAFGVVFGTRGRWPRIALLFPLLAYLFVVLISVAQAKFPNLAMSYPIQLMRMGLVFLAVARVAAMERGERALLIGLFLGLSVQAGYAIWARANGALQTGGSLGHQNLLGFISHLALMPAFALFLSGKMPRWAILGLGTGLTVVILTASRATIGIAGFALTLTLLLTLSLRFTPRKAAIGVAGVFVLVAGFALASATLERRFAVQNTTFLAEDKERVAFEKAAKSMISAYPMGVGPNHYVFIANTEGYSERAGVAWNLGSRSTQVHNTYLLVTAETGYLGILTLTLMLGTAIFAAFHSAIRFRRQPGSEIFIGLGVGIVAVVIHGFFEWMFVIAPTQYLLAGALGMISGLRSRFLSQQMGAIRQRKGLQAPKSISDAGHGLWRPSRAGHSSIAAL